MTGRDELDKKIAENIEHKLSSAAPIIKRYYHWLSNEKTMTTKRNYVNAIIRYSNYLNEHGNSIMDFLFLRKQKKTDLNMYDDYLSTNKRNGEKNGKGNNALNMYALKSFFDFLVDEEIIDISPFNRFEMPKIKEETPIVSLTKSEITKVKCNIILKSGNNKQRNLTIFTLGICTGLRIRSIIEINIEDIDLEENAITVVVKGNEKRQVFFGDEMKKLLEEYLEERLKTKTNTTALFLNKKCERITYKEIYKMLEENTVGINKHITPHKMRSTCGTNLYQKTHDIYLTADVLGHKNIRNTKRYADVGKENKRKAADILDKL